MVSTYELALIISTQAKEEEILSAVKKTAQKNGLSVTSENKWGKRVLSYPIKKHKEGIYVFWDMEGDTQGIGGLSENLRMREGILRYMFLKSDKPKAKIEEKKEKTEVIKESQTEVK